MLADAVAQRAVKPGQQKQATTALILPVENSRDAQATMTGSCFPSPVDALVNRVEPTLSVTLDDADWAEETPIPRVCTSEGAESFASLLLECVADSQKSLPLSGQTQLRMAVGQSIF